MAAVHQIRSPVIENTLHLHSKNNSNGNSREGNGARTAIFHGSFVIFH